jgi:hypothetical protein
MNNTSSLNQIITIFRDIATRSKMINDFGFGNTYDLNAKKNIQYPLLWIEPSQNVTKDGGQNIGFREFYYGLNVYVIDRIDKGDSNYQELLSDTQYILNTIIAEIDQHIFYIDNNMSLTGDIYTNPIVYSYDDNLNGYQAQLKIKVPLRYSPCNNPIQNITGFTTSLNANITEYRLIGADGATGPQGPTGPKGDTGATGPAGSADNVNLQNVLSNGNTATLGFDLSDSNGNSGMGTNYLYVEDSTGNNLIYIEVNGTVSSNTIIGFQNSGYSSEISAPDLTGNWTNTLPNKSGTFSLLSDLSDLSQSINNELNNYYLISNPAGYITGTALNGYELQSNKNTSNGYAGLVDGKLNLNQIPDSILGGVKYQGTFNPLTTTFSATASNKGWYYISTGSGTYSGLGFNTGDWIISDGSMLEKVDNTDSLTSFNGRVGNIILNSSDIKSAGGLVSVNSITGDINGNVNIGLSDLTDYNAPTKDLIVNSIINNNSSPNIWSIDENGDIQALSITLNNSNFDDGGNGFLSGNIQANGTAIFGNNNVLIDTDGSITIPGITISSDGAISAANNRFNIYTDGSTSIENSDFYILDDMGIHRTISLNSAGDGFLANNNINWDVDGIMKVVALEIQTSNDNAVGKIIGTDGSYGFQITPDITPFFGNLNFPLTSNRDFIFQDKSGTIALLSDIIPLTASNIISALGFTPSSLNSFTASSPLGYNPSTGRFTIQVSNAIQNGYLSSTDWNSFTNKQSQISLSTSGNSGTASFTSNNLNIPNYTLSGLGGYPITGGDLLAGSYIGLPAISQPTTPGTGSLKLYTDLNGRLTWLSNLGFTRTFRSTSLTGNRLYTLQDRDGILADDTDLATKQNLLNGTGIVKSTGGTISYINGTSTSFVKADGSLDSSRYLTQSSISFTGSNNYISKFSGTASLINSSLYDDGSNHIGLNTITPSSNQGVAMHIYNNLNDGTTASNSMMIVESLNRNVNYTLRKGLTQSGSLQIQSNDASTNYGQILWSYNTSGHDTTFMSNGVNRYIYDYLGNHKWYSATGSQKMTVLNNGNVGINEITPQELLSITGDSMNTTALFTIYDNSGSNSFTPAIIGRKSRGTLAIPTATGNGDFLLSLGGRGYNGSSFNSSVNVGIFMGAEGLFSSTSFPTFISFNTTPINTTTRSEVARFSNSGYLGLLTTAPTHTLTLGSNATGISYYNTSDQTTNYERVRQFFSSNIYNIMSEFGGTGSVRAIQIGTGTSTITKWDSAGTSKIINNLTTTTAIGGQGLISNIGTLSASTGIQNFITSTPTINQSGTASYRNIFSSPFESTVGSGTNYLIDLGTNTAANASGIHTTIFNMTNNGIGYISNTLNIGTQTTNTSAILQLSSTTKGFLRTKLTSAQALSISTPATGLSVYNTDYNVNQHYNGSNWVLSTNMSVQSKSATYSIISNDNILLVDATSGAKTITLPTAIGLSGTNYIVKKIDNSVNVITINTTSSQTIDGMLTKSINTQYSGYNIVSNGTNWYIIASF